MRQRQWNWEILDSRYYFSYGAPFVPWLQFVNFARRLPLPPPLPLPGAPPAAAQADVVSIAESISILLPNNVFFFCLSSSIDCVMLFIEPVRERKGCLCRVQPCRIRYELHVKMFYWLTIFYAI